MLELLLIRHGQTDWNRGDRVMGRQPIPLNECGRHQAEELAHYLKGAAIAAIMTSPVKRALETAQILCKDHSDRPLFEVDDLAEIDFGELVNLPFSEVHRHFSGQMKIYRDYPEDLVFPGGESIATAKTRVAHVIDRVRSKFSDGRVALVTHADVIKLALISIFALPLSFLRHFSIDNGAMVIVRYQPDLGPRLIVYNPTNGFGNDL